MKPFDPHVIVSPAIDEYMKAVARLNFFSRRLATARKYRIKHAIRGYEKQVCRSLDLLWEAQRHLERGPFAY